MAIAAAELKQSANFFRQASRVSIPGRSSLAAISQGKLQKESLSRTPDLRRCLGHHGVYRNKAPTIPSNATKPKSTVPPHPPIRSQITQAIKAITQRRHVTAFIKPENDLIRVPAHASPRKSNMTGNLQCRVKLLFSRKSLPGEQSLWQEAAS
ncbi:hypothetical protein BDV38DRAFT_232757 [Aspergillus pseudotamarii]|uniref:Uncharacterized protein n=1 Tax=Aspergillus pseudotamarii TaxID=132259 RepID=A0A5N6TCT8_ASPPS|nr:uncharacterized protein BDV38DRAFT_232757 [Aspergillus pseudotamarii]KAE8144066.1 hypothetical protein BDV38DRAFT_232757 [Aspergillus pseudotamarii]